MAAKLVVKNLETGRSFEFELARDEIYVGRAADSNDVVLDDGQVSRRHASIKRNGQEFMLIDLNSANGTFINGQRVKEHLLRNGDSFSISRYAIEFKDTAATPSIKYENQQIGNTVLMRAPSEIGTFIPQMDKSAIPVGGKSLMDYVEVLRKKAETLARIYELNQMLGSDFSQEDIFKKVSEMVFRLTPADRFLVLLKDADTGELATVAAEFRNPAGPQAREQVTISKTVVDRVMAERVSLLSFDTIGRAIPAGQIDRDAEYFIRHVRAADEQERCDGGHLC